ncbi:Hypothetical predicted protein, partial [Mytilus galloprovincialis]
NHVKEIGWLAKEKRYKTCGWWKLKWPWAQCSEYGLQAFGNQQKECSEAQMCKLQSDILTADTYKFQKKSCEDQFKVNKKMNATLKQAESCLDSSDDKSVHAKQRISEGIELLPYRQKLVKMADSSEHGWRVVQEYTSNPLADDLEDDRKIMRATSRA